jgi:sortase A
MRVLTEDHPALRASGGRLLSRMAGSLSSVREWKKRTEVYLDAGLLEASLKLLGSALIVLSSLAYLDMWVYQATESFHLGVERLRSGSGSAAAAAGMPRVRYAQGQSMGWIEIPRLGVSAVVAHGTDERTLRRAVGHIPGTSAPGEGGNVGLAAHRDTFFRALQEVRPSDRIRLVMPESVYSYRVEGVRIVRPDSIGVLDDTPVSTLTLVTCYPFEYIGAAPYRFIVRARETTESRPLAEGGGAARPESSPSGAGPGP